MLGAQVGTATLTDSCTFDTSAFLARSNAFPLLTSQNVEKRSENPKMRKCIQHSTHDAQVQVFTRKTTSTL